MRQNRGELRSNQFVHSRVAGHVIGLGPHRELIELGPNKASAASARIVADSGRVKNTVQSPAEIVMA